MTSPTDMEFFCVFLWWFCSLGTRLGMPLAHTLWVSLFCVSQIFLVPLHPPLILFDQYKKSKRTFFLLCPRMIDTLKQKMTHIMCLNLNKMSNTSIFLITEYFLGASEEKNWIRKIRSKWMMRKIQREGECVKVYAAIYMEKPYLFYQCHKSITDHI